MQSKFVKVQSYELSVAGASGGATQRMPTFENNPYLNYTQLLSIEIFSANDMSLSPSGLPLFSSAIMNNCTLCLYSTDPQSPHGQGLWLNNIPLWSFHRINNGTDPYVYDLWECFPRSIVWEQSYIQFQVDPANTVKTSFCFNIGYQTTNPE